MSQIILPRCSLFASRRMAMAPKSQKHKNENLIFKIIQFTLNSKIKKNIKIKWIFFFYCSLSWYHWMATEFQLILKGNELERAWKCCCPIHLGHRHCSWKRSNWYWEEIASEDMVDSQKNSATKNRKIPQKRPLIPNGAIEQTI